MQTIEKINESLSDDIDDYVNIEQTHLDDIVKRITDIISNNPEIIKSDKEAKKIQEKFSNLQ